MLTTRGIRVGLRCFVISALLLSVQSCKDGEQKADTTAAAPEEAPEAPELPAIDLLDELKLEDDGPPADLNASKPGARRFQVRMVQKADTRLPGKEPFTVGLEQTFELERDVTKREADRSHILFRIRKARARSLQAAEKTPPLGFEDLARAMERLEIRAVVTNKGEVESFDAGKARGMLPPGVGEMLKQFVQDISISRPEGMIHPGDSWKTPLEQVVERAKTRNVVRTELTHTFLGRAKHEACPSICLVFETRGTISETGKMDQKGIRGSTLGRGELRRITLLDGERNTVCLVRAVSSMKRKMNVGKGDEMKGLTREEDLSLELSLTALQRE